MLLSGTINAAVEQSTCSMACLQNSFELIRAVAGWTIRRAIRQQQLQVAIAGGDRAAQLVDGGARQQITAQALEHRAQQSMFERELRGLRVRRAIRACT